MERYYFLFFVTLIAIIFATIQDLKKREVANWLNFSLMALALAYRAFYSSIYGDWNFLVFGLMGFGIFIVLANVFYYSKIFAGGDAKMFMALGAVLPFESYSDLFYMTLVFTLVLFFVGAIYSLAYSIFIACKNTERLKKEFVNYSRKNWQWIALSAAFGLLFSLLIDIVLLKVVFILFFILVPWLYIYLKSLESSCMIKLVSPERLTEGDWLERDVKVGQKWIRRSVHGLSIEDIIILRRANKKVLIKEGIPFQPAFLITFLIMVCAYSALLPDFRAWASLF